VELEMIEARAGDIFVLPPGVLHALRWIPGASMEYENIIFELSFLGSGNFDLCAQKYLIPVGTRQYKLPSLLRIGDPGYEVLAECLQEVDRLSDERGPGYELGIKATMMRFVFLLLRQTPTTAGKETPGILRLRRILQEIEDEYMQPMTVAQAALLCDCSESHFMRWFKQMTGSSFTSYLNERRLAAAVEELRRTDDTILEIAERVGFENLSNFNRQFKAHYGVTPREYRRRHI
jgi:AraC-like DNA-binding protein